MMEPMMELAGMRRSMMPVSDKQGDGLKPDEHWWRWRREDIEGDARKPDARGTEEAAERKV